MEPEDLKVRPTAHDGLSTQPTVHVAFAEIARDAGVNFTYRNGAAGQELMVESLGGGVAWLDYDSDGLPDLYFTQGGKPDTSDRSGEPADQVFRQIARGSFQSVTADCRITCQEYGMGVAAGDFNNDGFDDLYITSAGRNRLFQNLGDGTFLDVTDAAGVNDDRWSSSAAWGDLDLDGDLDLYCCNYLQYDPLNPLECLKDGRPALCHPRQLDAWPDECFENRGDGTFVPVASTWGLHGDGNKGLGVVIADLNNDTRPDVYVANDTTANFLFLAKDSERFEESSLRYGGAVSAEGALQASMGIALGDYDGNGFLDLFLTHFTGESNTLYQNLGDSGLHDVSGQTGVRRISNDYLGFGTVMSDFDQNGTMELLVANGHIDSQNADGAGYAQPACLMTCSRNGWFDISAEAGDYFGSPRVGRGVAAADFDADGDLDIAIAHQNSPAALLQNTSRRGEWLSLRLIGCESNRSAIGTRVTVQQGERRWVQELAGGSSYCSTHQKLLVFGLGQAGPTCHVTIRWPGGTVQQLPDIACSRELVVIEQQSPSGKASP